MASSDNTGAGIRFNGNLPVSGEVPIDTQLPVESTVPTRANVMVDGCLGMQGAIPMQTTLLVNSTIPVDTTVRCRGDLEYSSTLPVHGNIPIEGFVPIAAKLPVEVCPEPCLPQPTESVSVQRIIRPAPKKEQPVAPPPAKQRAPLPNPVPRPAPAPMQPPPVAAQPVYLDPRPLLKPEKERGHDFEYHREGNYSYKKGARAENAMPHADRAYGGLAAGPVVDPALAPIVPSDADRAFTHAPVAPAGIDTRPPLKIEREKVHDFEVHREGAYAKGHTFAGKGKGFAPVVSGPAADSRRVNIHGAPGNYA
jgi:hypothetical protein